MPWTDLPPMDQRLELVTLAWSGEFTVTELAFRLGVSKKTAHKWIAHYESGESPGSVSESPGSVSIPLRGQSSSGSVIFGSHLRHLRGQSAFRDFW